MSLSTWDHSVHALRQAIPNPRRWTHIWGVIETAMALADRHGVDVTRTAWAALLHDGAKCLDKAALEQLLREHDLTEDPDDWHYPAVWHALVGAHLARTLYGIRDESILRAIRHHPTGTPDMDDLGLVLFVADYTEPTRDYPGAREFRRKAMKASLVETATGICRNKIAYVRDKGRSVHVRSLRTLESLEGRANEWRGVGRTG